MSKKAAPCRVVGTLRIREDLADKICILLEDPVKPGKLGYGKLKDYLETLIAKDLREREAISEELLEEILNNV